MADLIDPFNWTPTFSDSKKNIITDDIIPDGLFEGIEEKIKSYCLSNYKSYKPSANVSYSTSCNDTGGVSSCNCDISGVNCYPASCLNDTCPSNTSSCNGCNVAYKEAGGDYSGNNTGKICNSDECSNYKGP